mgnify:FL=1|jgi:hypothetical protein
MSPPATPFPHGAPPAGPSETPLPASPTASIRPETPRPAHKPTKARQRLELDAETDPSLLWLERSDLWARLRLPPRVRSGHRDPPHPDHIGAQDVFDECNETMGALTAEGVKALSVLYKSIVNDWEKKLAAWSYVSSLLLGQVQALEQGDDVDRDVLNGLSDLDAAIRASFSAHATRKKK